MELIGIFFIACGLLVLAGVAKAARPDDTARALMLLVPQGSQHVLSFTMTREAVRIGAISEAVLGVCALLFPHTIAAALVAVSYTLFLCITVYARTHGGSLSTCGCFGRPDTPSTRSHIVLNIVFVTTGVAVALQPPHFISFVSLLESQPWDGAPLLLASGVGVWFAYLALSPLAALQAVRRLASGPNQEALRT